MTNLFLDKSTKTMTLACKQTPSNCRKKLSEPKRAKVKKLESKQIRRHRGACGLCILCACPPLVRSLANKAT